MGERLIRPGIRCSDRTAALVRSGGWMAQVFYDWMLTVVDDFGRYDARPSILRTVVFPLLLDLVRDSDVSRCLAECEKAGLIRLYSVQGKPFLELLNFRQRLRANKSRWPEPINDDAGSCHDNAMTMPIDTDTDTDTDTEKVAAVAADDLPIWMKDLRFVKAWVEFETHRKEIRHPLKPTSRRKMLLKLVPWGLQRALEAIDTSISAGWQGVFEPKSRPGRGNTADVPGRSVTRTTINGET